MLGAAALVTLAILAAYGHRERALWLVKGAPGLAVAALQRAVKRGVIGLAVVGVVGLVHAAAAAGGVRLALCGTRAWHLAADSIEQHDGVWRGDPRRGSLTARPCPRW